MTTAEWSRGQFGPRSEGRQTWPTQRTVLAVVHNLIMGTRLNDILPLTESDPRVQVVFTVPPNTAFAASGRRYIRELDACYLPWGRATMHQFDLAVAASYDRLDEVRAPVMTVSHGVGPSGALVNRPPGHGPATPRELKEAVAAQLVKAGRVVPAAIGIAHEAHRTAIAATVPEAAQVTHVIGAPCHDRLLTSLPHRDTYRRSLGTASHQRLLVVSSSWGAGSLLRQHPDLPDRLVAELSADRYRVAVVPHPLVWAFHSRRQVRAWLSRAHDAGLLLVPPEEGWRAALVAADLVIGDYGSVTCYAAALGRPVLLGTAPDEDVAPGSLLARLGQVAPRLRADRSLPAQVAETILRHGAGEFGPLASLLTSEPGRSAVLLRRLMYRLMGLTEPAWPARLDAVPLPRPLCPEPDDTGREPWERAA